MGAAAPEGGSRSNTLVEAFADAMPGACQRCRNARRFEQLVDLVTVVLQFDGETSRSKVGGGIISLSRWRSTRL